MPFEPQEFSAEWIDSYVEAYAAHHEVGPSDVLVDRNYRGDEVVGIRLSLDVDGYSRGCDETFGEWR